MLRTIANLVASTVFWQQWRVLWPVAELELRAETILVND